MSIQITATYQATDEGHVDTWTYDEDGDFSHDTSSEQWVGAAWLHPGVSLGTLTLSIISPEEGLSKEAYAIYHGRFIEMLLAHFEDDFLVATATAKE
jgi:hypothetical protein